MTVYEILKDIYDNGKEKEIQEIQIYTESELWRGIIDLVANNSLSNKRGKIFNYLFCEVERYKYVYYEDYVKSTAFEDNCPSLSVWCYDRETNVVADIENIEELGVPTDELKPVLYIYLDSRSYDVNNVPSQLEEIRHALEILPADKQEKYKPIIRNNFLKNQIADKITSKKVICDYIDVIEETDTNGEDIRIAELPFYIPYFSLDWGKYNYVIIKSDRGGYLVYALTKCETYKNTFKKERLPEGAEIIRDSNRLVLCDDFDTAIDCCKNNCEPLNLEW